MKTFSLTSTKTMPVQANVFKKQLSIDWMVVISVIVFFGGALCGILFCGRYAHDPLTPVSGSVAEPSFQDQIERLETKTSNTPSKTKAWIALGNLYFDTDQYAKAMEAYGQVLARDPNDADVRIDLGILQRLTGRPMKAIASFNRVISQDPKNETARLYKAIVLKEDLNDREGAVKILEKILELNPLAIAGPDQSVRELVRAYRSWGPLSTEQP